jgi:hypothetical protein
MPESDQVMYSAAALVAETMAESANLTTSPPVGPEGVTNTEPVSANAQASDPTSMDDGLLPLVPSQDAPGVSPSK